MHIEGQYKKYRFYGEGKKRVSKKGRKGKRSKPSWRELKKQREEKQYQEDQAEHELDQSQDLQKVWECHNCRQDCLRIVILARRDGEFYFRRCNSCGKKTKLKRYDDSVKGPKQESKG